MNPADERNGVGEDEAAREAMDDSGAAPESRLAVASSHPGHYPFYIVGIGASAGGLEALELFFENIPQHSGLAFVVVQHLSPDFKSLMDELLARRTRLPIHRVEDGMNVTPNAVFLIPPKKELVLSGCKLCLLDRDPHKGLSFPIDTFFRSLGKEAGDRAIAVVLSGTGSDGSRGLRDIHAAGGLVLTQSIETAKFDGMPRSAIETGLVDYVLAPEQMPDVLVRYANRPEGTEVSACLDDPVHIHSDLSLVFDLLHREYGIDFSHYKPGTVARRVERRIEIAGVQGLREYGELLKENPEELNSLYFDLLIGVTKFFRDAEAFAVLEKQILPGLIDRLSPEEELRIWVAGCATGEEAYSLAILIHEQLTLRGRPLMFKMFATDVHPESLEIAGAGVYDPSSLVRVSASRLERFFSPKGARFQVNQDLRSRIVFSRQNVIRDAPFTRLDLISCRNLLIYFQPYSQRKVISLFHFGLKVGGTLFLGPSESTGDYAEEFETLDAHWKLFRKRRGVRLRPELAASPLADALSSRWPAPQRTTPRGGVLTPPLLGVYDALLSLYIPTAILINERREIVHCFGGAGAYLNQRDGRFSPDLLDMVEEGLRVALATAIHRVGKSGAPVSYSGIPTAVPEGRVHVTVTVQPLTDRRSQLSYKLISIHRDDRAPSVEPAVEVEPGDRANMPEISSQRLREVETELQHTKENLQTTIEELETSNEELQATNEELIASNEELQSTNEELHSVNEELYTVNAEHQKKIEELTELTSDLDNLFVSFDIGIVFLDRELRIRKFTPRIADQFSLIPRDVGRRIDGFAHNLVDTPLMRIIEGVLRDGNPYEGEVQDTRRRWYLLRVLPYTSGGQVNGIVVSLIDISRLKQMQDELAMSERRHKTLVEMESSIVWTADVDGRFVREEPQWERFTGQGFAGYQGLGWLDAIHEDDRGRVRTAWLKSVRDRTPCLTYGRIWKESDRDYRDFEMRSTPVVRPDGGVGEWVGQIIDVHDRKRDEQESRAVIDHVPVGIVMKDLDGRLIRANPYYASLFGLDHAAMAGMTASDLFPPDEAVAMHERLRHVVETGADDIREEDWTIQGQKRTFLSVRCPIRDLGGRTRAVVTMVSDVTPMRRLQQERAEHAAKLEQINRDLLENIGMRERAEGEAREAVRRRDQFLAMLSHELRNPLNAIVHAADCFFRDDLAPADAREAQLVVQRQAGHMARLLDDLLDVSRLNNDRITLARETLDLVQTSREALRVIQPLSRQTRHLLTVDVDPGPIWVEGDATRLQQIQVNLLNNALRYTPPGRRIWLSLKRDGDGAVLKVRDEGKGIPPEILERIFDLFYRHDDAYDPSDTSMGIGLTLVRRIVELHHGTVAARSGGPGAGSEFEVRLPIRAHEPAPAPEPPPAPTSSGRAARVVIVEDNPDTRRMLEIVLRLEGHEVHAAADGRAGLDLILEVRPEIALVDIALPILDGCEVARQVRADPACEGVLLVALTGYGQSTDHDAFLANGFDEHLVKPIRPKEISAFIQQRMQQAV